MDTTRTVHVTRTSLAASAAALVAAMAILTGCGANSGSGSSGLEGAYYSDAGRLTIKDSTVTYHDFECDNNGFPEIEAEPSASGELTEDSKQIVWASDDEHIDGDRTRGTDDLVVSGSKDILQIRSYTFKPMDEKDALAGYRNCSNSPGK